MRYLDVPIGKEQGEVLGREKNFLRLMFQYLPRWMSMADEYGQR